VRLTTEEIFAVTLLTPLLREFREAYPAVRIELETSDEVRDLAAGHADIALRSTLSPEGGGLVGRRLADENWTFYASRPYAAERPLPRRVSELRDHPLIGGGGERVWRVYGPWLEQRGLGESVAFHHSSATGLLSAVRAGVGLAALPCLVADREPDLVRCFPPSGKGRGLWLLTHERLRHEPRVRVVLDFLADRLGKLFRSPLPEQETALASTA
jgi:DNA-binding transcriptional LysR family regulator